MSLIDFSQAALSPNQSRGARNFLGMSQSQVAEKSTLPAHKLKRFETGNYVPDSQFLADLREFYENEGYDFNDDESKGAKAKARGDVFQAGVVGATRMKPSETDGSTEVELGKPAEKAKPYGTANLQFMRIDPNLDSDAIDEIFGTIEDNEEALLASLDTPTKRAFLESTPHAETLALTVANLRRLAENGVLYARLMGRSPLPIPESTDSDTPGTPAPKRASTGFFADKPTQKFDWNTIGDILCTSMGDVQLAAVERDKEAQARYKARQQPKEVLEALVN